MMLFTELDAEDNELEFIPPTAYDEHTQMMFLVLFGAVCVLVILVIVLIIMQIRRKRRMQPAPPKLRFRKRDKFVFYSKKFMRPLVRKISGPIRSVPSQMKMKKRDYIRLVNNIHKILKNEDIGSKPQLKQKEPPSSILEPALQAELQLPQELRIPTEVLYMLKNMRVFGHFESPVFLELCQNIETQSIPAGAFLFKQGHLDDSIYVVQSGKLTVNITEADNAEFHVKEVTKGDSVHSLLSIMDVITGYTATYKTVSAKAKEDTTVLRLPAKSFQKVFKHNPDSMVRIVQMMLIRLQRVTFQTLNNLLGLTAELIRMENTSAKTLSVHSIKKQHSPIRRNLSVPIGSSEGVKRGVQFQTESAATLTTKSETSESDKEQKHRKLYESAPEGSSKKPSRRNFQPMRRFYSLDVDDMALGTSPSDFEVAAFQARVHGLDESEETEDEVVPPVQHKTNDDDILDLAIADLLQIFELQDDSLFRGHAHVIHHDAGAVIIKEGAKEANLMFVYSGSIAMIQRTADSEEEHLSYLAQPGELIGEIAVLTGEPWLFTVKAKVDSTIISITKKSVYSLIRKKPWVVLKLGHLVVNKLSPFVRQTDFALDWMQVEAGKSVYRQGDPADCIYIVLNGRLRSVVQLPSGKKDLVAEYGRDDIVGVVEVLTKKERVTSVHAIRDTEVAKLPSGMLNLIKRKYPHTVSRLIQILSERLIGQVQEKIGTTSQERHPTVENLSTVAVVAISDNVPVSRFTLELTHGLSTIGSVLRLTGNDILNALGGSALDTVNEYRLTSWLGQQEDLHRIVLYEANKDMTAWTQRCIRQADCILIVGLADSDPTILGEMEKQLESLDVRAQKELILLHKARRDGRYRPPTRTADWLNARSWCVSHHHIRCPERMFRRKNPAKERETYDKLFAGNRKQAPDFARLARFLTGTSVGLVLGGGGARGIAQIGIIKALHEYKIPIDMVGGTSMGAFVGANYCRNPTMESVEIHVKRFCDSMGSLWDKIMDLTYPYTSMFSGRSFNRIIRDCFQDRQIEDLWIPYFSITTDINDSKMRIHTTGSLWRYVRASMSLSGYLPPLCDPKDEHLLLDGGYVNNLPADVMKSMGAHTILWLFNCSQLMS
ncbi:patatin-like phospholipase domain-containing protein 6 isoform X3 [Apostichopus japonicus]|uniref:patatin-like phospholipase domain-containing protein 6 isoform X3 n=1 Tax=Stichopus japonicus TaxID=307972 RepID=UPI003AB7CF64